LPLLWLRLRLRLRHDRHGDHGHENGRRDRGKESSLSHVVVPPKVQALIGMTPGGGEMLTAVCKEIVKVGEIGSGRGNGVGPVFNFCDREKPQ
jgi:hypothetical protein